MHLLILTILLFPFSIFGEITYVEAEVNQPFARYEVVFDKNDSMTAGATNTKSIHYLITELEDLSNWKYYLNVDREENSFLSGLGRLSKLLFIDYTMDSALSVINHEYHGHGYRLREYRANPNYAYKFSLISSSGATQFLNTDIKNAHHGSMVYLGGTEANEILGDKLSIDLMTSGVMDYRDSILYTNTYHDATHYISTENYSNRGHDMGAYIDAINEIHGYNYLNESKLKTMALINYIDPIYWSSLYAHYNFIFHGISKSPLFSFKAGNWQLVPRIRLRLAAHGPENEINLLAYHTQFGSIRSYFSFGSYSKFKTQAFGFEAPQLFRFEKFTIGLALDLWNQPPFSPKYKEDDFSYILKQHRFGVHIGIKSQFKIWKNVKGRLDTGYKSQGYLKGHGYYNTPYLRAGLGYSI